LTYSIKFFTSILTFFIYYYYLRSHAHPNFKRKLCRLKELDSCVWLSVWWRQTVNEPVFTGQIRGWPFLFVIYLHGITYVLIKKKRETYISASLLRLWWWKFVWVSSRPTSWLYQIIESLIFDPLSIIQCFVHVLYFCHDFRSSRTIKALKAVFLQMCVFLNLSPFLHQKKKANFLFVFTSEFFDSSKKVGLFVCWISPEQRQPRHFSWEEWRFVASTKIPLSFAVFGQLLSRQLAAS